MISNYFLLLFYCFVPNTFAWTIDLPEVRQYYFSKYGNHFENKDVALKDGEYLYDNYFSNSPHHKSNPGYIGPVDNPKNIYAAEEFKNRNYADDFEYQSYMEKKVHKIVQRGSRYLEGLRRAIQQYQLRLENCTKTNFTTLMSEGSYASCANATKKSEQVRRLAQLAIYTTRQIEDRALHNKYEEESLEDRALLLRLAFFLDKLTELTGFEPDPNEHLTTTSKPILSSPKSLAPDVTKLLNVSFSDEAKMFFINCLNNVTSENAIERCKFPGFELPPRIRQLLNISDETSSQSSGASESPEAAVAGLPTDSSSAPSEQKKTSQQDTHFDLDTSETLNPSTVKRHKSVQKRAIPDNPIHTFIILYGKEKAWSNVNPNSTESPLETEFNDENDLLVKSIDKRSVPQSDYHIPEDPMQDISSYVKHRGEPNSHPDKLQAERFQQYLEQIHKKRNNEETIKRRIKDSVYQRARIPEDPQQDISYYVKNKEGTEIMPNPVQAALVRLGLEQIFQTGNIEVVRRYGSNYNPLLLDHVTAGLLRSALDT